MDLYNAAAAVAAIYTILGESLPSHRANASQRKYTYACNIIYKNVTDGPMVRYHMWTEPYVAQCISRVCVFSICIMYL